MIYDNLRTAVLKDWGKRAVYQKGFERFSAHYAFTLRFSQHRQGKREGSGRGVGGIRPPGRLRPHAVGGLLGGTQRILGRAVRQVQKAPYPRHEPERRRALRSRAEAASSPSRSALRGGPGEDSQGGPFQHHRHRREPVLRPRRTRWAPRDGKAVRLPSRGLLPGQEDSQP